MRGDVAPGVPEVAETGEDALAEELLDLGLDELGRFIGRAVGWMKDLQGIMWDWDRPRAERQQASAEHKAIHDVALEAAKRGQGALAEVAQGRRSVGEGLQELFEATDPLPIEQAVEEVRREREVSSHKPTFGESVEMPVDLPPEAGPTPLQFPEHPAFKARIFERAKETDDPRRLARDILFASPLDQYLEAGKKADEFTDRMLKEGIIKKAEKKGLRNALEHFIAAYTITREFGSPEMTWRLGVLQELLISPITGRLQGSTKEQIAKDTEIDYYHNRLGIEEAVKSAGKEVPLFELVRRLAKQGKFRY